MSVTARLYGRNVARYSPWAEAAGLPHVSIRQKDLPAETGGAVLAYSGERVWIFLDRLMSKAQQRTALCHELRHLERGTSTRCRYSTRAWDVLVVREELVVDREVARLLVPQDELGEFIDMLVDCGETVTVSLVAEEFEVTEGCARIAMEQLLHETRRRAG